MENFIFQVCQYRVYYHKITLKYVVQMVSNMYKI